MRVAALAVVLLGCLLPAGAAGQEVVGTVGRLQGSATADGAAGAVALAGGTPIRRDDVVTTAPASKVEIGFVDGTVVTVGENAELRIDDFVFAPAAADSIVRLAVSGPFRYVSGAIGGANEGDAMVTTPVATIGLRGTDFWGGLVDARFGVFLIAGSVTVTTAAGSVTLAAPGEGTDIDGPGAPPGPATLWTQDKVLRALATVTIP